jgi:hypothetical protein
VEVPRKVPRFGRAISRTAALELPRLLCVPVNQTAALDPKCRAKCRANCRARCVYESRKTHTRFCDVYTKAGKHIHVFAALEVPRSIQSAAQTAAQSAAQTAAFWVCHKPVIVRLSARAEVPRKVPRFGCAINQSAALGLLSEADEFVNRARDVFKRRKQRLICRSFAGHLPVKSAAQERG